jgi:hypothetical protein
MSRWLPLIGTVLSGLLAAFTPAIQGWVALHPTETALIATVVGTIAHFVTPPTTPKLTT